MIRVIVADDHPVMRSGVVQVLRAEPTVEVVGEAADGLEVLEHPALDRCDVLMLDLAMPRLDGVGVLRVLADRPSAPRVLVLTAGQERIADAIEAGAAGCVLKDARPEELVDAVHTTARGGAVLAPAAASAVIQAARDVGRAALTQREIDVLQLVSHGTTNGAIASELGIGLATVKTHLQHAFEKLGAQDRAHAITIARDRGLL